MEEFRQPVDLLRIGDSMGGGVALIDRETVLKPQSPIKRRGLLVACEGLDGSGKSSLMKSISIVLKHRGQPATVSHWNDTVWMYNLMMRLNEFGDLDRPMRCIFGAAELAARYQYVIAPALQSNGFVFANKYLVSAYAHAMLRGHDCAFLDRLYAFALAPDLIIYVDISPEDALHRKELTGRIGYWEAGLDLAIDKPVEMSLQDYVAGEIGQDFICSSFLTFQGRLRELHLDLLASGLCNHTPVLRIDGMSSPDKLREDCLSALEALPRHALEEEVQ